MKINLDNRHNRKKEVVAVHFGSEKEYCWTIPEGMDIKTNDILWVKTVFGNQIVQAVRVIDSRGNAEQSVIGRVVNAEVEEANHED